MKSDVKTTFSRNFKRILFEKNISQAKLAKDFDLTATTLQRWMKGLAIPTAENLDRLSSYLNIEVSELFIRDVSADYEAELLEVLQKYPMVNGKDTAERWNQLKELSKKYSHVGGDGSILQEYAEPVGRVLPGIGRQVLELLKMAEVKNTNETTFYLVCLLLLELSGKKGRDSAFYDMINSPGFEVELSLRKEQLLKVAYKISDIPFPSKNSFLISDKINLLDSSEIEFIESAINKALSSKKSKQSVS